MTPTAIFWPMLAHVLLVYIVYVVLSMRRRASVRSGEARAAQFKLRGAEPESSLTVSANLMNQFELPVLFHVLCLALFATGGVGAVALALAWIFIALRYAHAYVHLTSNRLRLRSPLFQLGAAVLGLAWIWFALHLAGLV
ncbi:MAG TPA: hypothetical protein GX405_07490 [Rhizobiales bacterium]|nr:hypothetical protein [Hyphomicrobiales bacterium]